MDAWCKFRSGWEDEEVCLSEQTLVLILAQNDEVVTIAKQLPRRPLTALTM
jgi:hypothetical protein